MRVHGNDNNNNKFFSCPWLPFAILFVEFLKLTSIIPLDECVIRVPKISHATCSSAKLILHPWIESETGVCVLAINFFVSCFSSAELESCQDTLITIRRWCWWWWWCYGRKDIFIFLLFSVPLLDGSVHWPILRVLCPSQCHINWNNEGQNSLCIWGSKTQISNEISIVIECNLIVHIIHYLLSEKERLPKINRVWHGL